MVRIRAVVRSFEKGVQRFQIPFGVYGEETMEHVAHFGSLGCYVFEKVNEVGNWHSVLKNISHEIQQIKKSSNALTIIDPYFLNVRDEDAKEFSDAFITLL